MDYNVGHPATLALPDDLTPLPARIYTDPPTACVAARFNDGEIAYFKEHGFVVKRQLITAADLFRRVEDYLWQQAPADIIRRSDPATWFDSPSKKWTAELAVRIGALAYGSWKLRSRGEAGYGTEPFLVADIANHPNLVAVAQQLLGAQVRQVRRARGIYAVFPVSPGAGGKYGPHCDYIGAQLCAMVIVTPTPAQTGGFTVWPGSHARLHPYWDTVFGTRISADRAEAYIKERDAILRDTKPVETIGEPGDVVFWHPRLLHSAGLNLTASSGRPVVRLIVPVDYQQQGLTLLDDSEWGPGEQYQWWIDTRPFVEDVAPQAANLWARWGI